MGKDYYNILGVNKSATDDEVKKAFRKQAQKFHPDKKSGDEAKFKEVSEAYAVLGDKKKRAEYDAYGHTFAGAGGASAGAEQQGGFGGFDFSGFQQGFGQQGGVEFDFGDMFGDFFGGGRGQARQRRGRDISIDIEIDFTESAFGVTRKVLLTKSSICSECDGTGAKNKSDLITCTSCNGKGQVHETKRTMLGQFTTVRECYACKGTGKIPKEPCKKCRGESIVKEQSEIEIKIPAGISNGEMVRLAGQGEAVQGGVPGDLYVKVHVRPHKVFTREGENLRMTLKVKLTDAILGATYTIPSLHKEIDLKVPAGVHHGEVLRVRGKGIERDGYAGDILVTINIEIPKKLSRKAKKLIQELREEGV